MTLDELRTDQVIRDAQRFRDLLDSPVYVAVIGLVERVHYDEFRKAATDEERRTAQAKANVLDDVIHAIHTVISTGEREAIDRERKERDAELLSARASQE